MASRDWSQFMGYFRVHSQDQGLYVYNLILCMISGSSGIWAYGANDSTKANGVVAESSGL